MTSLQRGASAALPSDRPVTGKRPARRTTIGLSLAAALMAGGADAQEMRSAKAHQHGTSIVDIVVEGRQIQMMLHAPGADIVGFEYAPNSEAERQAVAAATETLSDPLAVFGLPEAAGCVVEHATVSIVTDADGDDHGDHEDQAEDREDHDEDHADHDGDHAEAGAQHLEFVASYHLDCADAGAVDKLALTFFDLFPNAQRLSFTLLGENGASTAAAARGQGDLSVDLGG